MCFQNYKETRLFYFLKILTTEDPIIIMLKLTEFVHEVKICNNKHRKWDSMTIPKL